MRRLQVRRRVAAAFTPRNQVIGGVSAVQFAQPADAPVASDDVPARAFPSAWKPVHHAIALAFANACAIASAATRELNEHDLHT
jgi:hypothetical protein